MAVYAGVWLRAKETIVIIANHCTFVGESVNCNFSFILRGAFACHDAVKNVHSVRQHSLYSSGMMGFDVTFTHFAGV